jgi:hypothetical protein
MLWLKRITYLALLRGRVTALIQRRPRFDVVELVHDDAVHMRACCLQVRQRLTQLRLLKPVCTRHEQSATGNIAQECRIGHR